MSLVRRATSQVELRVHHAGRLVRAVLFNSYQFLFLFFPAALVLHAVADRIGERTRIAAILAVSLVFYGVWDVRFLALLATSILVNFGIGCALEQAVKRQQSVNADWVLCAGVACNLIVLGYFKYARFLVVNFDAATGANLTLDAIILPLGISFFTFEQIGYLADVRRGHLYHADLLRYALFVSFFPRLVAGPILRYSEILPQLTTSTRRGPADSDIAVGLTIFAIGLCKKALLADGIASYANPVFAVAASGKPLDAFAAWSGALAYTFQLYFDFSGYSDMAIGAARCFGIRFPANFNSPYKATSMIEFWRCWHMTLSRFLRDYLYIPLGGNRRGPTRRYVNLMLTMLLGGLWHGANWTFIAWGGLHGLYLMVNHGWSAATQGIRTEFPISIRRLSTGVAWLLTFLGVVIAWVFFRSPTFHGAVVILSGMAGLSGATLPEALAPALVHVRPLLRVIGVQFGAGSGSQFIWSWAWILALGCIALALPNTQQLLGRFDPVLDMRQLARPPRWLVWTPSPAWAVATGTVAFLGIMSITRVSEFLYWQF
jgi:D-alanyl-lipoteichoic acid acyltransferase DltB (MBOAT superfamily)